MSKKQDKTKGNQKSQRPNWTLVLVVSIIAVVFLVLISNNFSSSTGSVVRGGSQKKPDLIPNKADMTGVTYEWGENSVLLANIQVDAGVANIGSTRAKESVLEAGMQSDYSLEGISTAAFVIYSIGTFQSATTSYYHISSGSATIGIKVNPLQAGTGEYYYVNFLNLPIRLPPPDGTSAETKFNFQGIADASSVISESNENNNNINRSYIVHCAYDPPGSPNPFCCIKRVDPLSTRYAGVRYCEDFGIY